MNIIKKNFYAKRVSDSKTLEIIKNFAEKFNFILDPHTATAVEASKSIKGKHEVLVLGTAHPFKFLDTIKLATSKKIMIPEQAKSILDKKEKFGDYLQQNGKFILVLMRL